MNAQIFSSMYDHRISLADLFILNCPYYAFLDINFHVVLCDITDYKCKRSAKFAAELLSPNRKKQL